MWQLDCLGALLLSVANTVPSLHQRGMGDAGTDSLDSSYWAPGDTQDMSITQSSEQAVEAY